MSAAAERVARYLETVAQLSNLDDERLHSVSRKGEEVVLLGSDLRALLDRIAKLEELPYAILEHDQRWVHDRIGDFRFRKFTLASVVKTLRETR